MVTPGSARSREQPDDRRAGPPAPAGGRSYPPYRSGYAACRIPARRSGFPAEAIAARKGRTTRPWRSLVPPSRSAQDVGNRHVVNLRWGIPFAPATGFPSGSRTRSIGSCRRLQDHVDRQSAPGSAARATAVSATRMPGLMATSASGLCQRRAANAAGTSSANLPARSVRVSRRTGGRPAPGLVNGIQENSSPNRRKARGEMAVDQPDRDVTRRLAGRIDDDARDR